MMKRIVLIGGVLGMALVSAVAVAQDAHQHDTAVKESATAQHEHMAMPANAGQAITVTGEVLDLSCYMAHEGKGEKHKACAQACIKDGAPIGVLTTDGQVYLLVEDHEAKKPYETVKGKAAEKVTVAGTLQERGGLRAIVVASVQ